MNNRSLSLRFGPLPSLPDESLGLSLVELIVALGLLAALLAAAYSSFLDSTQETGRAVRDLRGTFDAAKGYEQIQRELHNIVPLRAMPSTVADAAQTTALGNLDPSDSVFIPWPLVAFPGYLKSDLDLRTDLSAINPSAVTSPGVADAFRFMYLPVDSEAVPIALDGSGLPFPTSQPSTDQYRPIVIETSTEESPFRAGDFLIVADDENSDLIRVTGIGDITEVTSPYVHYRVEVYHDYDVSIWNIKLTKDFGMPGAGRFGYVQRIKLVTYAYDDTSKIVYRDDHIVDDGFNQAAGNFVGSPSLGKNWSPFLKNVSGFEVEYLLRSDTSTRTPAADVVGTEANSDDGTRGNELGDPELSRIQLNLFYFPSGGSGREEEISHATAVQNLLSAGGGGAGSGGGSGDLAGPEFEVGPPPPEPGPSPTPPQPGSTSTSTTTGGELGPPGGSGGGGF